MTPQQFCDRITYDLDRLAILFLEDGRRGAASKVIEMSCTMRGESLYDDDSPMDAAQQMAEGGAA